MKSPYVSELEANQVVTATFLVQQKDIRQKRTGEPYLSLILADRTGDLEAKMWDNAAEVLDTFERDDFVKVRGMLQVHQNRLQMTLHKLQREDDSAVDPADFFPASARKTDEMMAELRGVIASIGNPHLKALLEAMFADEEIARRFERAPAAKQVHHAYLGGLIEHVLSMCALARMTAGHYKQIDLDLLLTGVVLHDIGKIHELGYDRSFSYTSDGQLLGHIYIGLRMTEEKIRQVPDFPEKLKTLLLHMILSHHGELEYGSPKVPLFPEAMLLHHLDNLDAKMETLRSIEDRDRQVEGCWTGFSSALERSLLKKSRYLAGGGEAQSRASSGPKTPPEGTPAFRRDISESGARREQAASRAASDFAAKLQGALKRE